MLVDLICSTCKKYRNANKLKLKIWYNQEIQTKKNKRTYLVSSIFFFAYFINFGLFLMIASPFLSVAPNSIILLFSILSVCHSIKPIFEPLAPWI